MSIWKRIRGVLGIGALWSIPAGVVGAIGGAVASLLGGPPLLAAMVSGSATMGILFGVMGSGFAAVLTLAERKRSLNELSPWRAGIWGVIGGGALVGAYTLWFLTTLPIGVTPEVISGIVSGGLVFAGLGGALATGTVAIARRAPGEIEGRPEPTALPDGA